MILVESFLFLIWRLFHGYDCRCGVMACTTLLCFPSHLFDLFLLVRFYPVHFSPARSLRLLVEPFITWIFLTLSTPCNSFFLLFTPRGILISAVLYCISIFFVCSSWFWLLNSVRSFCDAIELFVCSLNLISLVFIICVILFLAISFHLSSRFAPLIWLLFYHCHQYPYFPLMYAYSFLHLL